MRCDKENSSFIGAGVCWLIQILGALAIFATGIKLGRHRRLGMSAIAFNILRMLVTRR